MGKPLHIGRRMSLFLSAYPWVAVSQETVHCCRLETTRKDDAHRR